MLRDTFAIEMLLAGVPIERDFDGHTFERLMSALERVKAVFGLGPATRIYLAAGSTDMRKGFPARNHAGRILNCGSPNSGPETIGSERGISSGVPSSGGRRRGKCRDLDE